MTTATVAPARVTVAALRQHTNRRLTVATNLDTLARRSQHGELPYAVYTAVYGICWARETGRLPGGAEMALRGLDLAGWLKLVAEVANACAVIAEVPTYLIGKLAR